METNSLCDSLLKWLETFPGCEGTSVPLLTDGVIMAKVLNQIAPEYFSEFWLAKIKADVGDNWRLKVSNLRKILQGIVDYYQEQLNQNIKHFPLPDLNKIGEHDDQDELGRMLQLILGCAVNCESKQQYIEAIMNMEERVQKVIMEAIQELLQRESSPGIMLGDGENRPELGPASFHPHIKTILEQLETASQARDEMVQRCHELEQQISVISEEKATLSSENEKLLNRLDELETGGDLGASTLRYKDLKKQIDGLQDELFKLETSRDEYRTKAEVLERENQEIQTRNEELQLLADQARSLKDEVDALREMSERAVVYEGTMETYKKKLEELSDLKRQVRILEEKNSDYMQLNMELEEEVKKSGTWRPQLDLYKKQVAELHQKLADEAKKTDRQIFENKKLAEKMEALCQEKDRLAMERDALKENIEELRCHVSALTSPDTSSRPPSDLSDVELLEIIPHEIRQKLMRLQHENSMLKQRAAEGGSSEQLPVLQTLVSDLQERQNSLTQENRWDCKGDFARTLPHLGTRSTTPPSNPSLSFLDAYFSVDPTKKVKLFKRHLKWASESDLLILRQPKGLMGTNFLSSTLPLQQPRSLPPLPVSCSSFATQTSKENPIVIRHIHEFKMSPSPTNEDSGCCRTSPSSCEGCEGNACNENHSQNYAGTLDSGVSGMYSGTLESGVSGIFRCLSPVIPSIVEECTTHHMTDILPALGGHQSTPTVMHHSHPAHTSCVQCCSPYNSQVEDNGDNNPKAARNGCVSPEPPRPHTVCSFNPPYRYGHATSPSPVSNLPVSPPLSPLPTLSCELIPLSAVSHPSSIIDLVTSSTGLFTCASTVGISLHNSNYQTSPSSMKTSLTYSTTTSPLPVSSPQGRRNSNGFPRASLPPESPTPHNSPRLPNSINATRSRVSKTVSTSSSLIEAVATMKDLSDAQQNTSGAHSPDKGLSQSDLNCAVQAKDNMKKERGSPVASVKLPSENGRTTPVKSLSIVSSQNDPSSQKIHKLVRESYHATAPAPLKQSMKRVDKETSPIGDKRKSSAKTTNGNQLQIPTAKEGMKNNEKVNDDVNKSKPHILQDKNGKGKSAVNEKDETQSSGNFIKDTFKSGSLSGRRFSGSKYGSPSSRFYVSSALTPPTPTTSAVSKVTYPVRPTTGASAPKTSTPITSSTFVSGAPNHTPSTPASATGPSVAVTPTTSKTTPARNINQSPRSSLSYKNRSLMPTSMYSMSLGKSNNHVTFREPVVSQVTQSDRAATPNSYSSASPRERMSPLSKTMVNGSPSAIRVSETTRDKKTMPVTLMSDTLFTHFVVSGNRQNHEKDSLLSATDTDTDLETLERRLTLGMYAAPLVSSESCTSFGPDDGDEDPSATEYCTDNASDIGDFNPRQFKPYTDDNKCIDLKKGEPVEQKPLKQESRLESLEHGAKSLVRTYSFFRKQSKAKKKRKNSLKSTVPLASPGGVVKYKNHTAKHMVAETFNAMFTLCTP